MAERQKGSRDYSGLFQYRRADRADIRASAAVNALFRINYIHSVSFGDCQLGAFRFASGAADTGIRDNIRHKPAPPFCQISDAIKRPAQV
jgi:hypothetical protein